MPLCVRLLILLQSGPDLAERLLKRLSGFVIEGARRAQLALQFDNRGSEFFEMHVDTVFEGCWGGQIARSWCERANPGAGFTSSLAESTSNLTVSPRSNSHGTEELAASATARPLNCSERSGVRGCSTFPLHLGPPSNCGPSLPRKRFLVGAPGKADGSQAAQAKATT